MQTKRVLKALLAGVGATIIAATAMGAEGDAAPAGYGGKEPLSLEDYVQMVLERNKSIQARLMSFHSAWSLKRAEGGLFEPAFVGSAEYDDHQRANTIEIERSLRSGGEFDERNQIYSAALELRTPLGSKVRVGASARRLVNNIQRTVIVDLEAEYEGNVGISVEQPLLKNAGPTAVFSGLRLATKNAEAAYQEYRRQMMQTIAEAEMAYWQLYYAQEEHRLSSESVVLAKKIAEDANTKYEAGRGSRLDMLEAEAGLSVRRTRESEARQKWVDAINHLASFFSESAQTAGVEYVASDAPSSEKIDVSFEKGSRTALAMSPDRLRARAVVEQEKVRVAYAHNQRLPEVNLKGSFGSGGLGYDYASAWEDVRNARFPEWTVSVEWRVPVWGGIRERNELRAARLRMRQAELMAQDVETQLSTGLDSARQRVDSTFSAVQNYANVVSFRDNLLKNQIQSAEIGRTDTRTVLEAEQELFAARLGQLQSEVDHERALLELQIISGSLLKARNIEVGMKDLEKQSSDWADRGGQLRILDYSTATPEQISSGEYMEFKPEEFKLRSNRKWHFWQRQKR